MPQRIKGKNFQYSIENDKYWLIQLQTVFYLGVCATLRVSMLISLDSQHTVKHGPVSSQP